MFAPLIFKPLTPNTMKHTNEAQLEKIDKFQSLCLLDAHTGRGMGFSPHESMRLSKLGKEVIYASIELGFLIKAPKKGVCFIGKRVSPQKIQTRMKILKAKSRKPFTPFWRCVAWAVGWFGYEIKRKSIY